MAYTAIPGTVLKNVGTGLCGTGEGILTVAHGIAALSTGTVELETGLSEVLGFWATALGNTDTETVVFRVREDTSAGGVGTLTIDGTKVDETAAVANAGSEQFCWFAIGYK